MKFDILTLFPDMFVGPLTESIIKRAVQAGHIEITLHNIRDWATDRHKTVDDSPYGGGAGMLMKPAPLAAAIRAIRGQEVRGQGSGVRSQEPETVEPRPNDSLANSPALQRREPDGVEPELANSPALQRREPGYAIPASNPQPLAPLAHVIYLSPDGQPFTQQVAEELAQFERLILVCGRYEGIDERVRETMIDRELSVGDFVLTGGELGAMIVLDVVARLVPGVLDEASPIEETFGDGLLEYPQYTRPLDWEGQQVPAVLLSGHHAEVATWRRRQRLERTLRKRPDLLAHATLTPADRAYLAGLGWKG